MSCELTPAQLNTLPAKERRGSRVRCVSLTTGSKTEVASRLTDLVAPFGVVVAEQHVWCPRGIDDPEEAKLGETEPFLSTDYREEVTNWWLTVRPHANTPTWDIVSQATIGKREGLILVEAKAHDQELIGAEAGKTVDSSVSLNSRRNHLRIGYCVQDANLVLAENTKLPWKLSIERNYQMSNRFAWAWKLTTMNIPVILVYLGFLKAEEMVDQGNPIPDSVNWKRLVTDHSQSLFPSEVWDRSWDLKGTALTPLIRTLELTFDGTT